MPSSTLPLPPMGRLIRPGIDISTWPEQKFAHGCALLNLLLARLSEWSASEPLRGRTQVVSDHRVEFRLHIVSPPPVAEWSLLLGDALHSWRSALDALTWELAKLDGGVPPQPKKLYFPMTDDETKWKEQVNGTAKAPGILSSIPQVFLDRLEKLQPWKTSTDVETTLQKILHRLDILDKHRGIMRSEIAVGSVSTPGFQIQLMGLQPGETDKLNSVPADGLVALIEDAFLMAMETTKARIVPPANDYLAQVKPTFLVSDGEGVFWSLDELASDLLLAVRSWLDVIYGGVDWHLQRKAQRELGKGATLSAAIIGKQGEAILVESDDPTLGI